MSDTPLPEKSLLAKTAAGAGWVVGFRLATRALGIISTLVLARVLGPGDFGLVALASGLAQTVDAISNLSVHEAIVRQKDPPRAMYDTAFTMNLIRGLITATAIVLLSRPVAEFFHEPRLATVLLALAVSNLIGALENIATADWVRHMNFKREFQLWTLPRVVQVAATIAVALIWPTYWALVFGIVFGRMLRTILSYIMRPYRPRISLSAWRAITGFTTWSWAIGMVGIIRDRIDTIMIGRLFSPAQVGIYALGGEIAGLPTAELVDPLCRACFPTFAQLRHDGTNPGSTYLRLLGMVALVVLPAGMGIAAIADPLVKLAFGERWAEAIPMIQIFGVVSTISAIGSLTSTLYSAFGMLRVNFSITIAMTVMRVCLLLTLLITGGSLLHVATLVAAVGVTEQTIWLVLATRRFKIRLVSLLAVVHRSLFSAGAMALGLAWLGLGFSSVGENLTLNFVISILAGIVIYISVIAALWLAEGRPDGAEQDAIRAATEVLTRFSKLPARIISRSSPRGA